MEVNTSNEILGDPYLQHIPLPRILNYYEPSLGAKPLPWNPKHCAANTARSNRSLSALPNGKLILSNMSQRKSDISSTRLQQGIRVLQLLRNNMAQ